MFFVNLELVFCIYLGGITIALIKHGVNVVGCARNFEKLQDFAMNLPGPGTFVPVQCDVSKEAEVIEMLKIAKERFGGIDICINNAGIDITATLLDGNVDEWRKIIDINIIGLSICAREAVKSMKEKGIDDGHVINIGSIFGEFVPDRGSCHYYSAVKFAVKALTEGTRNEVRSLGKNFRVTELCPGFVETDLVYRSCGAEVAKKMYSAIRCMQPEDVADSVVYILGAPPHVQITKLVIDNTDPLPYTLLEPTGVPDTGAQPI